MTETRTEIAVRGGTFHPVRISKSSRNGTAGVLLAQGSSWIWLDTDGFDVVVDEVDKLLDDYPQLGRVESFPRPEAVTPAKWVQQR